MRASAAGLEATRNEVRPAWYMAMLSGTILSQPSRPWISLPGFAVLLEAGRVRAALVIQQHHLGALADLACMSRNDARLAGDRAAVHADPEAVRAARGFRGAVEQVPDLQPPVVVPLDPLRGRPGRSSRACCGSGCAGLVAELALAVGAVADAVAPQAGPTVVGEALGVAALDDLGQHAGDVLVVVGAVDAGDVLVRGAIGLAGGVAREPVRMRLVEILGHAVGVHARQHHQAVLVRGLGQLAVEVAVAEELARGDAAGTCSGSRRRCRRR